MSRTSGIFTESSRRNCRLCRKNHDYYYNILTSNVACNIAVKDAIYDLVGLHIAVGDGLPTTMCPLCLKKLTEFSVFKKICLESDAVLRKSLQSNCCRSFEEQGVGDDSSGPFVETKGCTQDVIENNSQLTCSSQTTEIYLPVPDLVLPRDNELFHVKDEDEGNLSEGNYPVLYTSDPAGISTDVSDPIATDELALKGCAEADGPEGNLPEKQQSQEDDEEESFCPMLESDSDEGDVKMYLDPIISDPKDPAPRIKDPIRIRIRKKSWIRPSLIKSMVLQLLLVSILFLWQKDSSVDDYRDGKGACRVTEKGMRTRSL